MSSKTIRYRYKFKEVVGVKKVDVAGKNLITNKERSNIDEFEQKPISIDKFQPTVITVQQATSKLKTTKEMMDAKLKKKREKGAEKRQMLESMLVENTEKINKLKKFKKQNL